MREALVSWNHAQVYDCPTYEDYANRLGSGQYEKVYDLGECALFSEDFFSCLSHPCSTHMQRAAPNTLHPTSC